MLITATPESLLTYPGIPVSADINANRKNKSVEAVARFDAFIFLLSAGPPKLAGLREWRRSHVHVADTDFVSRGSLCGEPSPVSTPPAFAFSWRFHAGAIRFLLWWLFLHRRLRSRQRGPAYYQIRRKSFRWATLVPFEMINLNRRSAFLSAELSSSFDLLQPSLSASAPSVPSSGFPLLLLSGGRVTASVSPLGAGQNPRSDLDYDVMIHPKKAKSSRKYFRFLPEFDGSLCASCGNHLC